MKREVIDPTNQEREKRNLKMLLRDENKNFLLLQFHCTMYKVIFIHIINQGYTFAHYCCFPNNEQLRNKVHISSINSCLIKNVFHLDLHFRPSQLTDN